MRNPQWAVLYGMIGLLATSIVWLVSQPPRGQPISLDPPPTPAPVLVHISGEVD